MRREKKQMKRLNALDLIALIFVIIGSLNWGLVGLSNFNLVSDLFSENAFVLRLIYVLVASSGLYLFIMLGKFEKTK